MAKREGPYVVVKMSCAGCTYEHAHRYVCQGDSGCDVSCTHPLANADATARFVGDTTWDTPTWCPLRTQALTTTLASLQGILEQAPENG